MRARFANTPLIIALLVGALISIAAFAAFRGSVSTHLSEAPPPLPITIQAMKTRPIPNPVSKAFSASAAEIVSPGTFSYESSPRASDAGAATNRAQIPLPPRGGRGPSQLIRTANISVEVSDVSRALRSATFITDEQLGDVIGLNDETPSSPNDAHVGTMAIRVPQYRFEHTLDALGHLGKTKSKSVSAQDVSDQLVDAQARIRNLRRTEADILNIMDRSGNIEQVLNVTQELGNVREQIERLDAQIQGMQYQVAYSTINISFTSPAVVTTPTGFGVLGDAWKNATASLRDFTVSILGFALWLLAFSPYILVLALLGALTLRRLRSHPSPTSGG